MKLRLSTLTIALSLLAGCASNPYQLTKEGKQVEVLKRKPREEECDVVSKLKAENSDGSEAMAKNKARNMAADKGADSIYFDDMIPNGKSRVIMATAYSCN